MRVVVASLGMNSKSGLIYFTHTIDGVVHGAWYRLLEPDHIQLVTVGLLQDVPAGGRTPEIVARDTLEQFVRNRQAKGLPVPTVEQTSAGLFRINDAT
jgi:hypothetical protein